MPPTDFRGKGLAKALKSRPHNYLGYTSMYNTEMQIANLTQANVLICNCAQ